MQPMVSFPPFTAHTRLLALDCAGDTVAMALTCGDAVRATREAPGGAQASAALLPLVHAMLAELGWALADLDGIAYGQGPGAFTGLRTACAVAQGLAFGLARPVLAVDSLLIVAEDARAQAAALGQACFSDCTVVVDARMAEVYVARYRWSGSAWLTLSGPALARPADIHPALARPADIHPALARPADMNPAEPDATAQWAGNGLTLLPHPPEGSVLRVADRAAALGRLAIAAAQAQAWRDAADAVPVYVRDKVAQTTAERQAAVATP